MSRLQARLDAENAPPIAIEHRPAALRFTCPTWRPTLVTRVTDALVAELGPDEPGRRFKSF